MIKQIRTSKFSRIVASYLAIMILLEITQPMQMFALTSGPTQPEFTSFTPISTADMVDLSSGDFNYNIPVMDVGGYPLNLAYNSGITVDQEASWVGLGWNLNVGEVSRQVRGLPDDFKGDKMRYENDLKDNVTVGTNFNVSPALFGNDTPFTLGLGVQYNNYEGVTFKPSIGVSYSLAENVQVGVDLTSSVGEGASLTPSVSISKAQDNKKTSLSLSAGLSSRKGLENMGMSVSNTVTEKNKLAYAEGRDRAGQIGSHKVGGGSVGGSISFNNANNYTPTKRVAYDNVSNTFNATLGGEVFGLEGQVRITGYGSYQKINSDYKDRWVGAYGYEYTQFKNNKEGVMDFNREKEQVVSKNTNVLPVTNYTYDVYSIEGQGVSGMFRPYRSQIGYVYNDEVSDFSLSNVFGVELGLGNLVHGGANFLTSPSTSKTGRWADNNSTLPFFTERDTDKNSLVYEPTLFKLVGELNVDTDADYINKMLENKPLRIKLDGGKFNRRTVPTYLAKNSAVSYGENPLTGKIKRNGRLLRGQLVQKFTNKEADDKFIFKNTFAKPHHTAGIKVLQNDGTAYVYGKTVYSTKKIEATFDVSGKGGNTVTGLVNYQGSLQGNGDKYKNKITTPEYAHTYLITSVLSPDYEDIDDNGPTDNDLGGYTKFEYTKPGQLGYVANYKWRIPYEKNMASFNEGYKTLAKDNKGNYIYGEKELSYLKFIETKTHIAFFDLQKRDDARSTENEHGGNGSEAMYCIKSIRLYAKSQLKKTGNAYTDPGINSTTVFPVKTAHFVYNYELCKNTPNHYDNTGKLTLERLYFTYQNSKMGKYTPYVFTYSEFNPDYNMKSFDIWGNYKQNTLPNGTLAGPLSTTDFPFVEQDQTKADQNTSAWVLKSVKLPSGGELSIQTESDDYKYVQNKKAMQMFKVIGAGSTPTPNSSQITNNKLFSGGNHNKYLYVKVNDAGLGAFEFINKYLSENINKPIYFKFLLNMTSSSSDYVSGYFEIDQSALNTINTNSDGIAAIPLRYLRRDGGIVGNPQVNPIAKAGWGFGRTYLNRSVYSLGGDESNTNFISIVKDLVGSIGAMAEIFTGPNAKLESKGCAKNFDTARSWIRLENPNGKKLGGGLRVKSVSLSDNWDVMNAQEDNPIYEEQYGQSYSYSLQDGSSSGVATFEPNASPENPFVEPFYGNDGNYAERIGAPKEINYTEKPFGEAFFPSPRVTYSKVTMTSLSKKGQNGEKVIKKHATGKSVTDFYTSYDFPTKVDYTSLDIRPDGMKSPLLKLLNVISMDHLTASQGFTIETNDMNGKVKSEKIFAEGQTAPISRVDYKYNTDNTGKLNNEFITIDHNGKVGKNVLGVTYDIINDFNQSKSVSESFGFDGNLAAFLVAIFPAFVPMILPKYAYHENIMRTATTTKVIHRSGVLVEKIVYDGGSRISTGNVAWDADTGQVMLTKTINEYDDSFYNFSYPAHWGYPNMGMASKNIGIQGKLHETVNNSKSYFHIDGISPYVLSDLRPYFRLGDELVFGEGSQAVKLWVVAYNEADDVSHIQLMDKNGTLVNSQTLPPTLKFKIMRSGYRNQHKEFMATVTSTLNPIDFDGDGNYEGIGNDTYAYAPNENQTDINKVKRVINASAVEYGQDWLSQCENNLPNEDGLINGIGTPVNPYLYNTKGDWRKVRTFSFLTGRNNFLTTDNRKAGYFIQFNPFYVFNNEWVPDYTNWTYTTAATKFSPYGPEIENVDALKRYSSAQFGYDYKLATAVANESQYREMGFDGFEDYGSATIPSLLKPHFGFSQSIGSSVKVTTTTSHTGRKSLEVPPGRKVVFTRKIDGCKDKEGGTSVPPKKNTKTSTKK